MTEVLLDWRTTEWVLNGLEALTTCALVMAIVHAVAWGCKRVDDWHEGRR